MTKDVEVIQHPSLHYKPLFSVKITFYNKSNHMDITALKQLAAQTKLRSILSLFEDAERADSYSTSSHGLYLDYSKQNINNTELSQLFEF